MYAQPFSWARPSAHTPEGTGVMPGNNPAIQSFLTSSGVIFILSATTALYTVIAASHTTNITPLACNSLIPIAKGPTPGSLYSPGAGFANGFLIAGALVAGSSALKSSPNLYFSHNLSSNA